MISDIEPQHAQGTPPVDARLISLLHVLKRTRTILYTAMMDGMIKNTLWANADQNLLDYLDMKIATALEENPSSEVEAEAESAKLEASLWGLLTRPCVFDYLNDSKNESESSSK